VRVGRELPVLGGSSEERKVTCEVGFGESSALA